MYMEKARAGVKQLPRGFVLAKCKIEIQPTHNELIVGIQSDRPAPDFSMFLDGYTIKPLESAARDETLVLIPVALAAFTTGAADVARKAVKETKDNQPMLKGIDAAVYAALEDLQSAEDKPDGYTAAEIIGIVGKGGDRYASIKKLVARQIIWFGRDEKGRLLNGEDGRFTKYRLPTGPKDYEMLAVDDDLSD